MQTKEADVSYIMEEFVFAEVNSYDAIIDSHGNPIFETGNVSPVSIMDIVNNEDNAIFYIVKELAGDTQSSWPCHGKELRMSEAVSFTLSFSVFRRIRRDLEGRESLSVLR